jgi:thiol:disulfide interchange protein DsbD
MNGMTKRHAPDTPDAVPRALPGTGRRLPLRAAIAVTAMLVFACGAARGQWLDGWRETGRSAGAMSPADFCEFLDRSAGVADSADAALAPSADARGLRQFVSDPKGYLHRHGLGWTLLLAMLAGILLNLTPCVLPMIPVNLALIGAGTEGATRRRGATLGGAYGAGIALAHGIPGALLVAAGGGFLGALQSSPFFSLGAALFFLVLGLALLDVIVIDLARWRGTGGGATKGLFAAAAAGVLSMLLASACVSPVALAMLLLASDLYASGIHAAVLLPFALGLGMALPWPFLGAGLARMPRPGAWMLWVKRAFALFVLLLAIHYARLAWIGFRNSPAAGKPARMARDGASRPIEIQAGDGDAWHAALHDAHAGGRPVLVDFGASWCRNCGTMDKRLESDPDIRERLQGFTLLRVRAERPRDPAPRQMLEDLNVLGLPTFLVLLPD